MPWEYGKLHSDLMKIEARLDRKIAEDEAEIALFRRMLALLGECHTFARWRLPVYDERLRREIFHDIEVLRQRIVKEEKEISEMKVLKKFFSAYRKTMASWGLR